MWVYIPIALVVIFVVASFIGKCIAFGTEGTDAPIPNGADGRLEGRAAGRLGSTTDWIDSARRYTDSGRRS